MCVNVKEFSERRRDLPVKIRYMQRDINGFTEFPYFVCRRNFHEAYLSFQM